MSPTYDISDVARWVDEPNKSVQRTEFARDRARVMHSSALRRLGAKTQVMQAGLADFPRTRLTHSLECAQVGRELGAALGCDPDLVDAACLAHDLGHPPFGHNGERALNELAQDIGGFEGNAQSFRILTRLEPKASAPAQHIRCLDSVGLNLTRATLDAASKYPWARKVGVSKFGVYDEDLDIFTWMRNGREDTSVSFEAQVMDWADDVSYCVHDIEDAIHAGHLDVRIMESRSGRSEVIEIARQWYGMEFEASGLDEAITRLMNLEAWPTSYVGTVKSLASLKNLTSTLIGRFCTSTEQATSQHYETAARMRYLANVVVPAESRYEVTALKALAARFVMNREGADEIYQRQREIVADIVAVITTDPTRHLDSVHRDLWNQSDTDDSRKRVIIDQVASLTDVSIGQWHESLCA